MVVVTEMNALMLVNEGYAGKASESRLEAMEPYLYGGRIPIPVPKQSQVLIKVSLAPVNPSDVMFIKGLYGQPRVKDQPAGFEGVGTVVDAGIDPMARFFVGKRVAFATGHTNWGSWAEYAVAEAAACIPLIDGVRDEDGAAMIVNPLTALAMIDLIREEGEPGFVMTAGASQLAKLVVGLAAEQGLRPIVTVRREEQVAPLLAAGATHVLNERDPDFRSHMRAVVNVEKARIFLDAVTGPLAASIFEAMPRRSRWIIYGRLDLSETVIPEPGQLIFQDKRIEGFWLTNWMRKSKERREAAVAEAQARFADGRWSTDIGAVLPLAEAMERLPAELARSDGKIFLKP